MPLLWLSCAFLLGILLASHASLPWGVWCGFSALCAVLGLPESRWSHLKTWREYRRKFSPLPVGILLAVLFLGSARFQASRPFFSPNDVAWYNNKGEVRLSAWVIERPRRGERTIQLRLRVDEITVLENAGSPRPVDGMLLALLPAGGEWQYGDRLELVAKLVSPPELAGFSYREYLARQGIYSYTGYPRILQITSGQGNLFLTWVYALRQNAYQVVKELFPPPEAALLSGILLGIEDDIPPKLERAFQDTGTAHIIAISGFNIAILAGLFSTLSNRLIPNRWLALLVSIVGIAFYTLLVGGSASVVRAAVMGSVSLLGVHIGRRNSGSNSLAFTGAVMCAFNPNLLWDISFQLSFSATLGLVWFGTSLQKGVETFFEQRFSAAVARRLAGLIGEYCLFTLAAQATTLPVILYHFRRLSLSALLANPLILPPQPLVMELGGVAVLAGMALLPLGKALALLAWPLLAYTNHMVQSLATLQGGALTVGAPGWAWVIIYYLLLYFLARNGRLLRKYHYRLSTALAATLLCLAGIATWKSAYSAPDGQLHVLALPGTDGFSILVCSPEGRYLLVQKGRVDSELSSALARRLPLYQQRLDGLVLSSLKASSLEGLPDFLENYPPGWMLWNPQAGDSRAGSRLRDWTREREIPLIPLETGQFISLGKAAGLYILSADEESTVIGLRWDTFRALLACRGSPQDLENLQPEWNSPGLVLFLSEETLKNHTPQDWLALVPSLVIASSGAPGLPPEWLSIDRHDWIELSVDGSQTWVRTQR